MLCLSRFILNIKNNDTLFTIYIVLYVIHIQYKFQIIIIKIKKGVGNFMVTK